MQTIPARTIYRLDRTLKSGEVYEWYGSEIYDTRAQAEQAIKQRFARYQAQMRVVAVYEPEHEYITIQERIR